MGKVVFVGDFVSMDSINQLNWFKGYLAVENGKISKMGSRDQFYKIKGSGYFSDFRIEILDPKQFMIPGLVDCHTHAPQFPNIGLGLDRPLLEWLAKYTFPLEGKYSDKEFAANIYELVVKRLLQNGTTTACYFGSLHLEGTLELAKSVSKHHQRALVGKVSMNLQNDAGYFNATKVEVEETRKFVKEVLNFKNDLVQPIITPRFAVSCDHELMQELSQIAKQYNCAIQSHISENEKEIEYVLQTNPECSSYAEVYNRAGIFDTKCIMAHAVHLSKEEISLLASKGVSVAHCPASNTRLYSGLCPVRRLLNNNITVGLGTDVSGGDSASILDAMRRAMDVSTHLHMSGATEKPLNWLETFYLATLGGAEALHLNDQIGNFQVGKEFDALLIDIYAKEGPIQEYKDVLEQDDDTINRIQRFIYLGDDRNIRQVYVKGEKVKDIIR